ncbi:FHA domain-containing protein [Pseudobacteroides cellulosolvens]|uniref:FHA domain containing protein n=1 Tax=Pseudobacteroides cellulosolvens ATCC 35603 = DSM 2933 TaxID=398512 RepID=A0A0L6JX73_9FIRM|nr:FHA domain-containing protein [Pseudobacteroides cellulosolvens]KNY30448.1 FHA domain containing protein [Pseudobacteroides cellulosolvens ATCC 35603 = DSM 2933]
MEIKIFGDALNSLLNILFINKSEFINKLGISNDTCENWLKGKNAPHYGNSGSTKNVTLQDVIKVLDEQYQKRLDRGMIDEELIKEILSDLFLPNDTKKFLYEYINKPQFVQMLVENAYEYNKFLENKEKHLWKKAIDVFSDAFIEDNKIKIKLHIGEKCLNVCTDNIITLKRLSSAIFEELAKRDLTGNDVENAKEYYFKVFDKSKKIHIIRADNNVRFKTIEEIGFDKLELVEHHGETTVMIDRNPKSEINVYPVMERIFDNETDDTDSKANPDIVTISKNNFIVGRISELSDYVIPSKFIGRAHSQISIEQGRYFIKDLGSVNGTYLNEEKLKPMEKYEIFNNDIIGFVNFKYLFRHD